jgi:hypothetical protein
MKGTLYKNKKRIKMLKKYNQEEISKYFPLIFDFIYSEEFRPDGCIKAFITQKEAKAYAKSIGWSNCDIFRIEKRFEIFYIVGKQDIRKISDCLGSIDEIDFPTTIIKENKRQVLTIRKRIKK